MKFCKDHWDKLRSAIDARGLTPFVSPSGEEAVDRLAKRSDSGERTKENFDPLMGATMAIYSNAIECGGLYLLEGDLCPLCELDAHSGEGQDKSDDWIKYAADEQLGRARELGLVSVQ